jgi:hypothetical protein
MAAVIQFSDWDEFKVDWLRKITDVQEKEFRVKAHPTSKFVISKSFLFRGQKLASYTLRSSFDRIMASHGLGRNEFVENRFMKFMQQFRLARIAAGLNAESQHSEDDGMGDLSPQQILSLAAIAQHHGLPTRLLDWSRSPYVAAFFAFVEEDIADGNVAIWCMDRGRIESETCVRESDVKIWQSYVNGNARQVAQHGAFSLNLTKEVDLENVFLPTSAFMHRDPKTEVLFKLMIPRLERSKVLADLDLMRINYLSLFPDYDGVIRHMKWRLYEKEFSDPADH